jgi:hypothetical protein
MRESGSLSDRQPQDGQFAFSTALLSLLTEISWEQKEIFSIFNRSGVARIVFINRYFLTLVSSFTNLPPESLFALISQASRDRKNAQWYSR